MIPGRRMQVARATAVMMLAGLLAAPVVAAAEPLPKDFVVIQEKFYHQAFREYLRVLPSVVSDKNVKLEVLSEPAFQPGLQRNQWLKSFTDATLKVLAGSPEVKASDLPALRSKIEDKFLSYHHDEGFARFADLEVYRPKILESFSSPVVRIKPFRLPKEHPGQHTLDVQAYVNERFPVELQKFVRRNRAVLYVADSGCDDAYYSQLRDGFKDVVRFMGKLDNQDSQFFFAVDRAKRRMRFVACEIHGDDGRTRLAAIVGPSFVSRRGLMAYHQQPDPILAFNAEGEKLRFDGERDRVVIGFQNTVWWHLKNKSAPWVRESLSQGGADVALFRNTETGERVLSVANVYGDEMLEALGLLYARGLRRFIYLGTGGGLADGIEIGDVLLPTSFTQPDGSVIGFQNKVSAELKLPSSRKILKGTRQDWVATLIEETQPKMLKMKARGSHALDIESRYFAEFFRYHPVREATVVIAISDLPLGEVNYNHSSATRWIPMDSITRVMEQILATP